MNCLTLTCKRWVLCDHSTSDFSLAAFVSILSIASCEDTPLGVKDSLPNSSFSASSFYDPSFPPSSARLNGTSAWCSKTADVSVEYLEIKLLPYGATICAIATQGTGFKHRNSSAYTSIDSVTEYSVEYTDSGEWTRIEKVRAIHDRSCLIPISKVSSSSQLNRSNYS